MKLVTTRAGGVACVETGSGPPLLLVHSNGHDRHDFDGIVPWLADSFRTIAIDLPGFGDSPPPRSPARATASLMFDVVEDVVAALDLRDLAVLGCSIGGAAGVRLAARMPERVRGLVLVSSGGFTPVSPLVRAFCWVQGREIVRRLTGLAFARSYLHHRTPEVQGILERHAASRSRPGTVAVEAALWRSFPAAESDVTAEARAVRCPTLLVWGRRDPVSRARVEGARARASMPSAQFTLMDTGHAPYAEDRAAFLREVLPFLDALPEPRHVPAVVPIRRAS